MKDVVVVVGMFVVMGGLKFVFEIKDFFFGDILFDQQFLFWQGIEVVDVVMKEQCFIVVGLVFGIGQFVVVMVGFGKVVMVVKVVVLVVCIVVVVVEGFKGGKVVMESGKVVMVGVMVFDLYEVCLFNFIQDILLVNFFNVWFVVQFGDSVVMGCLKNVMESFGMDVVIIGIFMGVLKVWKYFKVGKIVEVSCVVGDMERVWNEYIVGVV